jgi:hypothetical protein
VIALFGVGGRLRALSLIDSKTAWGVRREKGRVFLWVPAPPGQGFQPEATGAVMEVTIWLRPSGKERHELLKARVCRPQRAQMLLS